MLKKRSHTKHKEHLLITAVEQQNIKKVRNYVESGFTLDTVGPKGTALHYACEKGNFEICELLIDADVPLNILANTDSAPIHLAARHGYKNILKKLIEKRIKIDIQTAFERRSALHLVCCMGHFEIAEILLNNGADVNDKDIYGTGPIHSAVIKGDMEMVELLMEHGASVDLANKDGWTPLHFACQGGNVTLVKYLLKKNAPLNCQNIFGRTPLHWTVVENHLNIAQVLLDNGANPRILDLHGKTPIKYFNSVHMKLLIEQFLKLTEEVEVESKIVYAIKKENDQINSILNASTSTLDFHSTDETDKGNDVEIEAVIELTNNNTSKAPTMVTCFDKLSSQTKNTMADTRSSIGGLLKLLERLIPSGDTPDYRENAKNKVFKTLEVLDRKLADFGTEYDLNSSLHKEKLIELLNKQESQEENSSNEEEFGRVKLIHYMAKVLAKEKEGWKKMLRVLRAKQELPSIDDVEELIETISEKYESEEDQAYECLCKWLEFSTADRTGMLGIFVEALNSCGLEALEDDIQSMAGRELLCSEMTESEA